MANVLTDKEMDVLAVLGRKIIDSLSCDINDSGVPCRTHRFEAIRLMKEYLQIHEIYCDTRMNNKQLCRNCQGRGWYIGPSRLIGDADYGEHDCEICDGDGYV